MKKQNNFGSTSHNLSIKNEHNLLIFNLVFLKKMLLSPENLKVILIISLRDNFRNRVNTSKFLVSDLVE